MKADHPDRRCPPGGKTSGDGTSACVVRQSPPLDEAPAVRKQNLDSEAVAKLNAVIRGTANCFATGFSTCRWMFQKLDSWIRMRLRAMKPSL